jgi:endoglucanase
MSVGEAAHRLYKAGFRDGVQRVQGFYLNVSNYRATEELTQYGTWVVDVPGCRHAGRGPRLDAKSGNGRPHFDWCPSQYDFASGQPKVNYTPEYAAGVTAGSKP